MGLTNKYVQEDRDSFTILIFTLGKAGTSGIWGKTRSMFDDDFFPFAGQRIGSICFF